jgi:hypothetical protein
MPRPIVFPKPGIYRGATANVSAGRWFDANMMRWRGGQAQPIGGNAAIIGAVLDGAARDIKTWHDNTGVRWAAAGTDHKLYVYNFNTQAVTDITPAGVGPLEPPGAFDGYGLGDYSSGAYGTARDPSQIGPADVSAVLGDWWSMDLFGEDLVFVPTQDGHLYRWSPATPTAPAVLNTTAPDRNRAVFVTDQRAIVLLGAGGDNRAVAWCEQENDTVWTAAIGNLAGTLQLQTEGRPLCGMRTTGGNLIFTDNDLHSMTYVGPPYGYGIVKIGANCGPISQRAISQAGGETMWMGQQSFWKFAGAVQPVASDVSDWLFSLINRSMVGRIFASPNPSFTEHWFYWPDEGATECNRYVAVDYGEQGSPWIIGQQTRTASDVTGAMLRPILSGPDGHLYMHEYGWLDNGNSRVGSVYLETGDIDLSQWGGSDDLRFHVRQIAQDFTGPANAVGYRFFLWEEPDGPQWDTGVFPITNDTGLTDARFSCRGCRMRIEALADETFAIGRSRLIVRPGGSR